MNTETSVPPPRLSGLSPVDAALLDTLLKEAPIGFAFFTPDLRYQRVNRTLATIYGVDSGDCHGRTPSEVLDEEDACAHETALSAVLAGESVVYSDHHLIGGTPSRPDDDRHWAMSWFPAHDAEGQATGVALIAVDISDRHKAETTLRRSEERYRSLLQASNQIVWAAAPDGRTHEDCAEWRAITGQDPEEYLAEGWLGRVHVDDRERVERAWDDAVQDRTPFDATFRVRIRSGEFRHYHSRAVPLVRDDAVVEWVGTHSDITTQREAEEMRQRLTQQLGEAALRTVRLQKATSDLAEALTVDQVVHAMTEIGETAVGVYRTAVALLDRERLRLRLLNSDGIPDIPGAPPAEVALEFPSTMTLAVRERKPAIAGSPQALLELMEHHEDAVTYLRHTDERAWVALPLMSAGRAIGALRFAFNGTRDVSDEERIFLEALAGQCALALERATLYEREHRTAEALQQSLLPEDLPEVRGIRFASLYNPGTKYVQVGGDWYDAFELSDGRVAGVLGDVMGKGIKAATGMSRVRNALRALAFSMPEPADVLTGLDRMFDATERDDQITTLAYFVLEPGTGHGYLGNAGHLPPLVVAPDAEPRLLETEPATPLGMPFERAHHKIFVQPGNTVVLYSDGLVENRRRSVASGLDELVTVASQAPAEVVGDPQKMLEYLVENMLAGYEQDDDVTLLAVHVPAIEAEPED
ncbi:SpoIIE family protein phosphatase [Marinactinospora thermotolerans]|uniref:PAS domain S-box-containing protein n=1 Tax=Marinactinospora thermotolerans DSM 45154 TaxID=1122192 RepID=A0A1T4SMQ8_9ACTN|nr:SpoIIE family protein phosphatase [Marinactinospora thermotolerans]SKA29465.1 PAS domain S-box-containing protein [Marinactinospora thermotolerans DSM 45154]